MSSPSRRKVATQPTEGVCRHEADTKGIVVTKSTRGHHTVDRRGLSSPSRQEVVTPSTNGVAVTKSTRGHHTVHETGMSSPSRQNGDIVTKSARREDCRHQVNQRGLSSLVDKRSSHSRPKGGCRHQVDKRSCHSRPKGAVVTKSTRREGLSSQNRQEGGCRHQSTEGRHTVDRRGCRHQVNKKGMSSPSRQEVVTQSTEGGRGHQVNPRRWSSQGVSTDRVEEVD
jgi:hypothetical protein